MTREQPTTVDTPEVDGTNVDQARAWDGDEGGYWAANHELFETCLERYDAPFLHAAAIQPGQRVLDVGCGTGGSTRAAARFSRGEVLGVDLSTAMITVARRLAAEADLRNVAFQRADAQVHPFEAGRFDVVISRTGAMFFGDPPAAFANLRQSLRPGGRIVLLTWQDLEQQEWATAFTTALTGHGPPPPDPEAPGPFSLSDPDRIRALLEGAGFADVALTSLEETTSYGRSVEEAQAFLVGLLGWMVEGRGTGKAASLEALRSTLAAHAGPEGVRFGSAAWLVTARRP